MSYTRLVFMVSVLAACVTSRAKKEDEWVEKTLGRMAKHPYDYVSVHHLWASLDESDLNMHFPTRRSPPMRDVLGDTHEVFRNDVPATLGRGEEDLEPDWHDWTVWNVCPEGACEAYERWMEGGGIVCAGGCGGG
ncbi:hypothetical protein BKA70DRAFT_1242805 [Coprinopsis sp. MPI-PUGE-AT-0042]|nr:hypothetical protein BKA70DRAFT_1242805 [Coprinopsis sp. MPI-PUGE-AT-0042]